MTTTQELIEWCNGWHVEDIRAEQDYEMLAAISARLMAAEKLNEALKIYWNQATGNYKAKSCGHEFTCVCIGDKTIDALTAWQNAIQ
jgi:hypothetical protein